METMQKAILSALADIQAVSAIQLAGFENSHKVKETLIPFEQAESRQTFAGAQLKVASSCDSLNAQAPGYAISLAADVDDGSTEEMALGFHIRFENWNRKNFVLFPAEAYNGNRFRTTTKRNVAEQYHSDLYGVDMAPVCSPVPGLNIDPGPSQIQMLTGDMSTPAFCVFFAQQKKGLILLTDQGIKQGDTSMHLTEFEQDSSAVFVVRNPGVREDYASHGVKMLPSADTGVVLKPGELLGFSCQLFVFDAGCIQDVYDNLYKARKNFGPRKFQHEIPFSAVWAIQEKKYNEQNWENQYGYFSVGMREDQYQDWQTGWTGGMNTVYPLLAEGNELTRSRVLKTFDFLFDGAISPSGFYWGIFHKGRWGGNSVNKDTNGRHFIFLRRTSDALYFIMKELAVLHKQHPGFAAADTWIDGIKTCADAYQKLWERYGQFGHWIHGETGEILLGRTASNGIAPAALALCAQYFDEQKYLDVACAAAKQYYTDYVQQGITNAGPGDILQNPDSESAFGVLESFVVLYETTQDTFWLQAARDMAHQCATWVVSYDFRFPPQSTFAKMGMLTDGTVIANVQNKHSAPGICTLSGDSLFKLFRYTGDESYLNLIKDIAHAIPQYLSREDKPISDIRPDECIKWRTMAPGWMNERINMSDWEERGRTCDIKRGEIFGGSCWCEVSMMLTWAEVPGIYVQPDTGFVCAIDHVEACVVEKTEKKLTISITNPTKFDASVKLFAENSDKLKSILGPAWLYGCRRVDVKAGESVKVELAA